jgi:energy-coupling factor transporter ATP-binding protein EcfA2
MSERIALSRILAVNWYGYRQFIDVAGLSLITGANGSGKSALLDLIQFVMLGEAQSKFNKAAAGAGSGRSLRGYCLCDTNTTGRDGAERYLRPSSVTLAALEFTWPVEPGQTEPRRETWGARIEYESPTAKPSTVWFRAASRVEWSDFLREDDGPQAMQFLPEDEFRTHVKRDLEGDAWDRQKTYLDEMALRAHLGFDPEQMAKTLPRAMAFEPESNFEKFVREFLLEPGMPDVRAVKASVDAHRRAQERLNKMHDQLARLTRIATLHKTWLDARRESALYAHLADALKHEEALDNLNARRSKLEEKRAEHIDNRESYDRALSEREDLRHQVEAARAALGDKGSILEQNRNKRREIEKELKQLHEVAKTAREFLRERARRWDDWLKHASALGLSIPDSTAKELTAMRGHDEAKGLDAVNRLVDVYHTLRGDAEERLRPLENQVSELEARAANLRRDLDHLREGHAAPAPLLNALKSRGQRAFALARVIEVKPEAETWWPLLEALIGENRQAILPEDFRAAWEVAQKTAGSTEALLNPEELTAKKPNLKKGSLRDFLETKNAQAQQWIDLFLGDVMPVKKTSQLEQHERALSLDGWLKDPPRRLRLVPEKELTLGEEGLRRLRDLREGELRDTETQLTATKRERDDWRTFLNRAREWQLHDFREPEGSENLSQMPRLKKEAEELDNTYELLATPERIHAIQNVESLSRTLEGVIERIGRLSQSMGSFEQFEREQLDAIASYTEQEEQTRLSRQTSRALVTGITEEEITERLTAAQQQTKSWRKAAEMAAALSIQLETKAGESRRLRDNERRDLIATPNHPELAEALDVQDEDNDAFEKRRLDLETHELERFKDEAEKARLDWEDRLQHQVLDVLREKLAEADRTKRELNRAMDHEIGGWRYQLTSRADKAHTAIWTLVEKGLPTGAELELFNATGREDIERAKAELMAAIDAADNPEDKRHQRALDYRFYHHWDIEAKPAGRGDAAAISLNKSAKKQSGGENQAPFFVATLAAFRRVYDLGRRDDPQNLGLVVMDEAFSKLSGDRIDDCLAMARNFGLQLIMAFPEDRLPTMFQHADTVVQCRVERQYDDTNEQIMNIENWVVRVEGSRLMELVE